jgi:hypothetical protein
MVAGGALALSAALAGGAPSAGPGEANVTVVVPSTCEVRRANSLLRAVSSLLAQRDHVPRVLVVANGDRIDSGVVREAASMANVSVEYQAPGSLPNAIRYGRSRVRTEFFGFLDDDDEYLPGAIGIRLAPFLADSSIDVVVTKGVDHVEGEDRARAASMAGEATDPLRSLLSGNWLSSCGGLFRTARVPLDYFDGVTRYFEWTLTAYKLAATRRIRFLDQATFRVHPSPGSLSRSKAYLEAEPSALSAVLALGLPIDVRRALRRKLGRAHHGLASMYLADGLTGLAMKHHLRSILAPGGLAYLPYSRKFLPF